MKGEWKIYKSADKVSERIPPEGRSYLWNIWVVDKSNKAIAQIHSNNNDVLEANAHLIAAAPKLHKELTALMQRFRTAAIMANLSPDHIDGELEGASEALAKAEGK